MPFILEGLLHSSTIPLMLCSNRSAKLLLTILYPQGVPVVSSIFSSPSALKEFFSVLEIVCALSALLSLNIFFRSESVLMSEPENGTFLRTALSSARKF